MSEAAEVVRDNNLQDLQQANNASTITGTEAPCGLPAISGASQISRF